MKVKILSLLISLLFFLPKFALAVDLFGASRTYLQSRETTNSKKLLPLYEYLDLNAEGIGAKELSFNFGGWGRADLKDSQFDNRVDGNLQYAYLSYNRKTDNSVINLGRFFIFEGVGIGQVDGLYAKTDLWGGFGISAFGGVPAEIDSESRKGEYVYGGRIKQGIPGLYQIGLSYLKEDKIQSNITEEVGGDLWFRPWEKLEIQGKSAYSFSTSGWTEHDYSLVLGSFSLFRLRGGGSWVDYKNYFDSANMSAFKFPSINPNEKVLTLGGAVDIDFTPHFSIAGEYKNYNYDLAGSADYFGGKLIYSKPGWGGAGFSVHRMNGGTDKLKYNQFRVYGYKNFGKADVTLDLLHIYYDVAINGVQKAYSVVAAAGYNLTEKARFAADLEYSHNPDFDKEFRTFIKFIYQFGTLPGIKGGK